MFLAATCRRNPALIAAAAELHRSAAIPANCYVVDLDAVGANTRALSSAAANHGLDILQMTKQFGRNPLVAHAVLANGIGRAVAVDIDEAHLLRAAGIPIGHLGHLVQVPGAELGETMRALVPEQLTVFSAEQAERVGAAADELGSTQPVLLRVRADNDFQFATQAGGVHIDDLRQAVERITTIAGVRFAGITSFPCIQWDSAVQKLAATPNLATLVRARELLGAQGLGGLIVNAPGANCCATMATVAEAGVTQVEPGSALIGATPLHAICDQPEIPAMVYVTEVSHTLGSSTYVVGGGFYARSCAAGALVYTAAGAVRAHVKPSPAGEIDYYGALSVPGSSRVRAGDSVVYSFRSQVFVTRAAVAVVTGIGSTPRVEGIYDARGNPRRPRNATTTSK